MCGMCQWAGVCSKFSRFDLIFSSTYFPDINLIPDTENSRQGMNEKCICVEIQTTHALVFLFLGIQWLDLLYQIWVGCKNCSKPSRTGFGKKDQLWFQKSVVQEIRSLEAKGQED